MKKQKTYFIKTFGCQMNKSDSERIAGWYKSRGWELVKEIKKADEVVINTCSVRESAENRVLGLINNLSKLSRRPKIILTGCMFRYPLKWLKDRLPEVDEFRKIHEFYRAKPIREALIHAWVPVMEGCNNFCTYCVVPMARGREVSRPFEEIVCEIEELVRRGYKEVTLLGQNVNSYGKTLSPGCINVLIRRYKVKTPFAALLGRLHQIKDLKKISFLTSNPWDLNDEIIEAMALPKIDRHLHLAVQSGDDEILRRMNRKYTAKQFIELVKKIRMKIPGVKIGTDIIVGFPGETEEQFRKTVSLCKKVGFEKAYIAMYSPRWGTAAYKFKDNVPYFEKKRRWRILEELINQR
jgi:tRNA-2-methylthio-N6-dimethylallyladenosine synthase